MNNLYRVLKALRQPNKVFRYLGGKGLFNWMPDEFYLKLIYRCETGNKLNLKNPKAFNEKIQWLKLNDRRLEYVQYVDKYGVRSHIADSIGEKYLIPLIDIYDTVDEIPWGKLPDKFVLKCTHGSHCNIICTDKYNLDIEETKSKLSKWLKNNWYWFGREWVYKNVKPRIVCEKYMGDLDSTPNDYKVMCFNSVPKIIQVHKKNLSGSHYIDFYGMDGNLLPIRKKGFRNSGVEHLDLTPLQKVIEFAGILSEGMIYLRTDFYIIRGKTYFGELTFFDSSGFIDFQPEENNLFLGRLIDLHGMW